MCSKCNSEVEVSELLAFLEDIWVTRIQGPEDKSDHRVPSKTVTKMETLSMDYRRKHGHGPVTG